MTDQCDATYTRPKDGTVRCTYVAGLENITDGRADPYLEAILAVTHNRKRALRNVPGFRRER